MKNTVALFSTLLLLLASASAEIMSIDITIFGMDWEVCAHAVRVSLKSVSGVDSVDVSLQKGLASVKMKPGNASTLKLISEAISKNGFTMKQSTATIAGKVIVVNSKTFLQVIGSNEMLELIPAPSVAATATSLEGKAVVVDGTIPEAGKGKSPESILYHSLKEGDSK